MTDKKQELNEPLVLSEDDDNDAESGSSSDDDSRIIQLCEETQDAILEAMKAANAMPSGQSRDLYAAHPEFIRIMDSHANDVLHILSDVLEMQGVPGNIRLRDTEEKLEMMREFNDNKLERIESNLDEMSGIKAPAPTVLVQSEVRVPITPRYRLSGAWNDRNNQPAVKATLITGTNVARPQSSFRVPIDNSSTNPFVPKIREKPNSLKPLAVLPEYDSAGNIESYLHPYEFELSRFQPAKEVFEPVTPQEPLLLEETPLTMVNKESQLADVLRELKAAKEIAIDLEHHSYRSYLGFTCLMQMSTRSKDYIVDALALRDDLHILNEVFTDPKKLKVLHGSISDIEWLQRDLGLYLVNMFDTAEAARLLQFSRLGLQFLLKHYCNIDTDKTFQLADWRIRPIPDNFIEYARKDTHYLLYIYDRMKNELLEKSETLLQTLFDKSTFLCQQRYQKPVVNEDTIMNIYRRSRYVFDHRQMYAFREILYWRDRLARLEDESPGYVLPQHMALDIACKLPREMQGILASCTPVPSLVRQHLHTLHQIILKARELPELTHDQSQTMEHQADTRHKLQSAYDFDNPLLCPHDDAGQFEVTGITNHPTLLGDLTNTMKAVTLVPQVRSGLVKNSPDMGVMAAPKVRAINTKGQVGMNENDIGMERLAKLMTLQFRARALQNRITLEEDTTDKQKEVHIFNTPFERYTETCRLRNLKEQKQKDEQQKQPTSSSKQQPVVVKEERNESVIQLDLPAEPVVVVEEEKPKPKPKTLEQLMTQNQLKRLEEAKNRKAIAAGEKLCFNEAAAAQKSQNKSLLGKRDSFPMEINVSTDAIDEDAEATNGIEPKVKREAPRMAPFKDPSKFDQDRSAVWNEGKAKTKQAKRQKRNQHKFSADKGSPQSSNKPVATFDYNNIDFGRFQGGSKALAAPRKGKRGAPGNSFSLAETPSEGSTSKVLHPNSRIAKNIKKTEKMFNLSSSNLKRK